MLFRSDRKSTRLNSSHTIISYAVFCLKKKRQPSSLCRRLRSSHSRPPQHRTRERPQPGGGGDAPGMGVTDASQSVLFFFNDTATTEIYALSLHDALPI